MCTCMHRIIISVNGKPLEGLKWESGMSEGMARPPCEAAPAGVGRRCVQELQGLQEMMGVG